MYFSLENELRIVQIMFTPQANHFKKRFKFNFLGAGANKKGNHYE